jgi:diguanylate cyclase (GGDEF)-like protein
VSTEHRPDTDPDVAFDLRPHPSLAADFRSALMAIHAAVVIVGHDGTIRFANPAADRLLGLDEPSAIGQPFGLPLTDAGHTAEIELRTPGGPVSVEMRVEPCAWGTEGASVVVLIDVTHRVHTEARLRGISERLELATAGTGNAVFDWDLVEGRFHAAGGWHMFPSTIDDDDPERWFGLVHPDDAEALERAIGAHLYGDEDQVRYDHRLRSDDGQYRWVSLRARAVFEDGAPVRLAGVLVDIDEQRQREDVLRHAALHDPLTGLANRALLLDRMEHAVQRAIWEPRRRYAVVLLDLDGFKAVNDTHGHAAGDELLRELADRMRHAVRPADTIARLGGDEFAVLVDSFVEAVAVEALTQRLRARLSEPVVLGDGEVTVQVSASIGAVISTRKPTSVEALLELADAAMYRAKAAGGNCVEFDQL